jgi:hypothetical protein
MNGRKAIGDLATAAIAGLHMGRKHVICVKTKLETLIVNVVCHDKMHMFAKFGHIITC